MSRISLRYLRRREVQALLFIATVACFWLISRDQALTAIAALVLLVGAVNALLMLRFKRLEIDKLRGIEDLLKKVWNAPAKSKKSPRPHQSIALGKKLWLGFGTHACHDLEELKVDFATSAEERSRAALELAKWFQSRDQLSKAKENITLSRVALPRSPWRREQLLLAADVDLELGNIDDALAILDEIPQHGEVDLEMVLRYANAIAYQQVFGESRLGESSAEMDHRRLAFINRVYLSAGLATLEMMSPHSPLTLDNLRSEGRHVSGPMPLVSVIVPAFNSAKWISTTLDSLLNQSWSNLEIIVVDDCSTDETATVVSEIVTKDNRVTLKSLSENLGPYNARNIGADLASGKYITVVDSDDWAHPDRIRLQTEFLEQGRGSAVTAHLCRVTESMIFVYSARRFRQSFLNRDMSSLMMPATLRTELGGWQSVRAGGDAEFIRRIEAAGMGPVSELDAKVPLLLSRRHPSSLTSSAASDIHSAFHSIGARSLYRQASDHWYSRPSFLNDLPIKNDVSYFRVPNSLLTPDKQRSSFDVILMSDLSQRGAPTTSTIEEIRVQSTAGISTAIVHHGSYRRTQRPISTEVWEVAQEHDIVCLSKDDKVTTDILVLRSSSVAGGLLDQLPEITAKQTVVVIDQTPGAGPRRPRQDMVKYEGDALKADLSERFGADIIWFPVSPEIREAFIDYHSDRLDDFNLSESDWTNIIDLQSLKRPGVRGGSIP